MDVRSVMTPNPACCKADTPLQDVARMMVDNDCGQIPVVNAANAPIGVVTDRDIAIRIVAQGRDSNAACAQDCMTTPVNTVSADSTMAECCEMMEREQVRRLPVVDSDGSLCGIVSLADVAMTTTAKTVAEVVKQVSDPIHH